MLGCACSHCLQFVPILFFIEHCIILTEQKSVYIIYNKMPFRLLLGSEFSVCALSICWTQS